MIFKIQLSLNDGGKVALVYDRDYNYQGAFPSTELPNDIYQTVKSEGMRAFYHGTIVGNKVCFSHRAPPQDW